MDMATEISEVIYNPELTFASSFDFKTLFQLLL